MDFKELEEKIAKTRDEEKILRKALQEADRGFIQPSFLPLKEVKKQMGQGTIYYSEEMIRIREVSFFQRHVRIPLPIDYLRVHTKKKHLTVLVNEILGLSLTMQFSVTEKKNISLEEVKAGILEQLKTTGIYIELLEEGMIQKTASPLHFLSYRLVIGENDMYHLVFYTVHQQNGSMLVGDYNCLYEDVPKWKNIMKATMSYLIFQ